MEKFGQKSQVVIYKTETGETKIDVRFDGETVWLTIEQWRNFLARQVHNQRAYIEYLQGRGA